MKAFVATVINKLSPQKSDEISLPRLLLVDDEPRLLTSLCQLLSENEYQLHTAPSGAQALEQLQSEDFDMILLDLELPDISGHEIMDFINTRKLDTSIIVLSGNSGLDTAINALKRGAYSYLRKPYCPEELLKTVHNVLEKRKLKAQNRQIAWQLQCSEKLYRNLIDNSPDIIYTLNDKGYITFINERATKLLGFQTSDLIGKHYTSLIYEEDIETAQNLFLNQNAEIRNAELQLKSCTDNLARPFDHTLVNLSISTDDTPSSDGTQHHAGTYVVARDTSERKRAAEIISYHIHYDTLTGLPNRVLLQQQLEQEIQKSKQSGIGFAVMYINLDRFKLFNDTLGHIHGDTLLQKVSIRLKDILRSGDLIARLGGDEFVLCLPGLNERNITLEIAERCLNNLRQPFYLDHHEKIHLSASVGISLYPSHGDTVAELLSNADIAMYNIKTQGKDGYGLYNNLMLHNSHLKVSQEQDLRRAMELNQLEMYYQPQVDLATGKIIGAESLMRWNHPERGVLSAGEFLPAAEENGLMLPLSDWMISAVFQDILTCRIARCEPLKVSLNISPQYLERGNFYQKMSDALVRYSISPDAIELEITENICIRNPQYAIDQLNQLCKLGIGIAIDDFGTGYSSLAYLHRFPINTIKIDRSFVMGIKNDTDPFPVILAIISIAHGLNLNLIAEGVETEIQANYLVNSGCEVMQGYLYHKPMPIQKLISLLPKNGSVFS